MTVLSHLHQLFNADTCHAYIHTLRMLGAPRRDGGGRAVRQEVDDAMRRQIDEDGAIPMAPPPGPLVDADGLQGWAREHSGCPHETQKCGGTRRQPQAGRKSGPR